MWSVFYVGKYVKNQIAWLQLQAQPPGKTMKLSLLVLGIIISI